MSDCFNAVGDKKVDKVLMPTEQEDIKIPKPEKEDIISAVDSQRHFLFTDLENLLIQAIDKNKCFIEARKFQL